MINWHSPKNKSQSEIANFSYSVLEYLKNFFCVNYIDNEVIYNLNGLNIYNIGNNFDQHGNIYKNFLKKPDIVILHDLHLKDFFKKLFYSQYDLSSYEHFLRECSMYSNYNLYNKSNFQNLESSFQFFEMIAFKAKHIIVHNKYAFDKLTNSGFNNISLLNLPYTGVVNETNTTTRISLQNKLNKFKLVIFGHIGSNRYVVELYNILKSQNLLSLFELNLVGKLDSNIMEFISNKEIIYHGYVDDLSSKLKEMDLCINIRMPSVGESSSSLLHSWANLLPCLVLNTKYYSEIPVEAIFSLDINFTTDDLIKLLMQLRDNQDELNMKAQRGYECLIKHHSPFHYAEQIFEIISKTNSLSTIYKNYLTNLRHHLNNSMLSHTF